MASEFKSVDGRKFLAPDEVLAGVPTPSGVLALLLSAERRGSKINRRLFRYFSVFSSPCWSYQAKQRSFHFCFSLICFQPRGRSIEA